MNPLVELQKFGQSFWYDNIRRGLITSGELKRMIDVDGLRGMTSNPTIFEKAIGGSADYDEEIRVLVARGLSVPQIYESLTVSDIQAATDLFRGLYDREHGADGYVSLEVSPKLAHDTTATIAEAERLWALAARPNVMIKVPATPEGLPAIEHLIGKGLNINVTLMFALATYDRVAEAYIRGLETLERAGKDVSRAASVASLFVSRVDTAVDKLLEKKGATELMGKTAIANSRLLYQRYKQIFHGERFAALKGQGARPQRLLWASTSTKNPKYSDVMYAEALIGAETVDTMPDATIAAFRNHGRVALALENDLEDARRTLERLKETGIDLDQVMLQLQDEGVKAFADSYDKLLETLGKKREGLASQAGTAPAMKHPRVLDEAAGRRMDDLAKNGAARLWARDTKLWKDDVAVGNKIFNRLGWLDSPANMEKQVAAIQSFAAGVKAAGFTGALLLGMGGSSLCPEVCRNVFGVSNGFVDLRVVDTTDPGAILRAEQQSNLEHTLFINASKSGTTIESASLAAYFWNKRAKGENFVAITDRGTVLDKEDTEKRFRQVFRNAADIGGRYAALSYFGLVPAALMGIDTGKLLARAMESVRANSPGAGPSPKDGVALGALLGELAQKGRDKLTFIMSPKIADFGNWVEQLVAESTGKEGQGIVPILEEPLGEPEAYGNDRVFVAMLMKGDAEPPGFREKRAALEKTGHPFYLIELADEFDLGAEFFRWEVATAMAGAVLGINPFDEPNVTESKENTGWLLKHFETEGKLPDVAPSKPGDVSRLLEQARAGDYVAILAFLDRTPENMARVNEVRNQVRKQTRLATTVGFGPRYLHSTGQLHKGGPNNGIFIVLTADDAEDAAIPGRPYTFSVLKRSQALGDLEALKNHGRRVVHLHLGRDVAGALDEIARTLSITRTAAD